MTTTKTPSKITQAHHLKKGQQFQFLDAELGESQQIHTMLKDAEVGQGATRMGQLATGKFKAQAQVTLFTDLGVKVAQAITQQVSLI